ncbi:unnamed protein product [Amaranthus hypochondriacus]
MEGGIPIDEINSSIERNPKQSWTNKTMSTLNSPPLPLLALFGIVVFYLYLSTYFPYKESLHRAFFQLKLIFLVLPALLFFLMRTNYNPNDSFHRVGGSPWGVALVVVLLLVLVSYHSTVGSHWFRPLWYDHYY